MTQQTSKKIPWFLIALTIPALAVLLALGTWQVQRLAWKEDLLATIETRLAEAPVPLASILTELEQGEPVEYAPVTVSGTFDHDHEQHFFATHNGRTGYYVYTPLEQADGRILFVNRGFVPFELKEAEMRPESLAQGTVTLTGLAREILAEKPSWVVPDNDLDGNIYYWKDIAAMTAQAGYDTQNVIPLFVDAGLPSERYRQDVYPVPGVTLINLPNNHLQYAVTWYGLAFVLVIVVGIMVRRRLRETAN